MSDINSILVEGAPHDLVAEMVSAEPSVLTAAPVLAAAVAAVAEAVEPTTLPATPAEVVEPTTLPATPTEQVLALSDEVAKTLHDVFTYIHEGFEHHSLMIGLSRFYEIAKAVKEKVEA